MLLLSRHGILFWLGIPKVRHVVELLAVSCVDSGGRLRQLDTLRRRLLKIIHGAPGLSVSLDRRFPQWE